MYFLDIFLKRTFIINWTARVVNLFVFVYLATDAAGTGSWRDHELLNLSGKLIIPFAKLALFSRNNLCIPTFSIVLFGSRFVKIPFVIPKNNHFMWVISIVLRNSYIRTIMLWFVFLDAVYSPPPPKFKDCDSQSLPRYFFSELAILSFQRLSVLFRAVSH